MIGRRARASLVAVLCLAPFLATVAAASASAAPAHVAPVGVARAPTPLGAGCSTPPSAGRWGSGSGGFFDSVDVQFYVPGSPGLSGSNFNTSPCSNNIPTYLNGFWMNISTDVPIDTALVSIWGLTWSLPNTPYAQPISGYMPGNPYDSVGGPQNVSMYIVPPTFETADFYFNDYKNFWPGSTVYFNLTVSVFNATPSILRSSDDLAHTQAAPAGTDDLATWEFNVASPWTSNNFTQDIAVSTTPSVLGTPAYDPNPDQTLQITLTALNLGGGTTLSIPDALLYLQVYKAGISVASYSAPFGPSNHSVEELVSGTTQLPQPLGPFAPGSEVVFNITAWVPWEGGAIDRLYSPYYEFNWSTHGGWPMPHSPLGDNLVLTTTPSDLGPTAVSLNTMEPVNVSIHEPIQNVTLGPAYVKYLYHDRYGSYAGAINMTRQNANTSYAEIPGLPAGGNLTFSVLAKDINNDTVASGNFTYYEAGPLLQNPSRGYGYLFFEAVDLANGQLVPNLPFEISNATWSERGTGTSLGFAGVAPPAGLGYLALAYTNYTVTVYAFGAVQTAVVHLSAIAGGPIVFYFTTAPLSGQSTVAVSTFPIAGTIGIAAAALAVVPIRDWFKERRKKAEAEQKRISL